MANNKSIKITLDGDETGLVKSLDRGEKALDKFGKETGGIVGEFADSLSGVLGKAGGALAGFGGIAAIAGVGIAKTFESIQQSAEKTFEVLQASAMSQMGIEQIQQMANMYAKVGLTMENIADQQKDLKDKIGDAITNIGGSVYTDIIQPLKLNTLELSRMADAGEDVIAKIYYTAKQQGYSTSQIANMMETLGNDATKRVEVLKQFNSEQDYLNTLANQNVQITAEQVKQFTAYNDATRNLSNAWEAWNNNALAPVAAKLVEILNTMTAIISKQNQIQNPLALGGARQAVNADNAQSVLDDQKKYADYAQKYGAAAAKAAADNGTLILHTDQEVAEARLQIQQKSNLALQKQQEEADKKNNKGFTSEELDASAQQFQSNKQKIMGQIESLDAAFKQFQENAKKSLSTAYGGNLDALDADLAAKKAVYEKQRQDLLDSANKDEIAAKSKADAAAKKAAADAKKQASDRLTAQNNLNKAISDMTLGENARQLAEFDRQQNMLVESIKKSAKTLGIDQYTLQGYLDQQQISSAQKRNDMINSMIGYSDPNKSLTDTNDLIKNGNLNGTQRSYLADQQNQRINGDNPFNYDNTDQKLKENTDAMNAELAQNDLLLKGHEDYEKRKAEITAKYNAQAIAISNQNAQDQLSIFSNAASGLAQGMVAAFGETSGAAKAAYAVSRGITIAQTILSIQSALAQALATPFPASLAAYAQVLSLGMSIISTAKGANSSSGQFHGGIDELPSTYDNKSFVLKAGERVVQPEANKKLTSFLDNQDQDRDSKSSGDITVNAPLIVQGGTVDDDAKFNEMLKKHQNNVVQAVRSSQKRNT